MNNEFEFIPYEQAMALKELGFNEPCIYYFVTKNFSEPIGVNGRVSLTATNKDTFDKMLCTAPLWQQAFKWFRTKHDLPSWIESYPGESYHYQIRDGYKEDSFQNYHFDVNSTSQEEAELACLKKLIEIVKNKKP